MSKGYENRLMPTLVMLVLVATMPLSLAAYTTPDNPKIASQSVSELSEKAIPGQVIISFSDADVMAADGRDALVASHKGSTIDRNPVLNCVLVAVDDTEGFIEAMAAEQSVKYAEPNYIAKAVYTPNDPGYPQQWGPPAIKADVAWDVQQGNYDNVKIAIVDTGIDYTHEDLGNYVSGGYDWANIDFDPWDDEGHGTHCAGIAAAVMDNDIGIAGIAQVQVMAEKVLDADGFGSYWAISQGIIHATEEGADVISMSLGGSLYSPTLKGACQYAWDAGCILIGAAGNDGIGTISYPARFDTVVCVGAIDQTNTICGFSNWGPEMELVAPGHEILSTTPGNNYASWDGTSMATPHVSGVAALVWSNCPGLTNQQVRDQMAGTADDLGPAGWDQGYGYGRVDADEAIICGQTTCKILFDQGHDNYIDSSISWDTFIDYLEDEGYQVDTLYGPVTLGALSGYDVFITPLPQTYFTGSEISAINSFVADGNGALFIGEFGGGSWNGNMNDILTSYGMALNPDVVYDPTDYEVYPMWPIIHEFVTHEVTAGIENYVEYAGCSLGVEDDAFALAWGDDDAYAQMAVETTVANSASGISTFGVKNANPITLAAWDSTGRVATVGDSNMFSDTDLDGDGIPSIDEYNNKELILNLVGWLCEGEAIEVHVSITTDRDVYHPGDTMIRHLEIDNPTASSVTFNMYLGVPQLAYWGTMASASIPAGFSYADDLPFPVSDWGPTPFGMVWYVELTDGTGEVLDSDAATCAYSPGMAVSKTSDAVGAIEKSIRKAGQ